MLVDSFWCVKPSLYRIQSESSLWRSRQR